MQIKKEMPARRFPPPWSIAIIRQALPSMLLAHFIGDAGPR
jgi:hypothetical protein